MNGNRCGNSGEIQTSSSISTPHENRRKRIQQHGGDGLLVDKSELQLSAHLTTGFYFIRRGNEKKKGPYTDKT